MAAAVSLALTAPALGSAAGDQYLPQVPSTSGNGTGGGSGSSGAADGGGRGGEGSVPSRGAGNANTPRGAGEEAAGPTLGGSAASAERDGDSGGLLDTLLDPLVRALIAGVLAIVLVTILARRCGDRLSRSPRAPRERGPSPPTPDDEIVAGDKGPTA